MHWRRLRATHRTRPDYTAARFPQENRGGQDARRKRAELPIAPRTERPADGKPAHGKGARARSPPPPSPSTPEAAPHRDDRSAPRPEAGPSPAGPAAPAAYPRPLAAAPSALPFSLLRSAGLAAASKPFRSLEEWQRFSPPAGGGVAAARGCWALGKNRSSVL